VAFTAGMKVVITPKKNRKEQREYEEYLYRLRHFIENAFLQLKRWRGIATRYAKNTVFLPCGRSHPLYRYLVEHIVVISC